MSQRREFQANAFFCANDLSVRMISNAEEKSVSVSTSCLKTRKVIDYQSFDFQDPADVAAAFAKYSNSVTWAVTREESLEDAALNGM
mgnify:CR=1 FL=1